MVDQAALVGGITIGVFAILFLGMLYWCVHRHRKHPKPHHRFVNNEIQLGGHGGSRIPNPLSTRSRGRGYDDLEAGYGPSYQSPGPPRYDHQHEVPEEYLPKTPQPVHASPRKWNDERRAPHPAPAAASRAASDGAPQYASNRFTPSPYASAPQSGDRLGGYGDYSQTRR